MNVLGVPVLPLIGLLIGCMMRTLLPYVVTGLEAVRDAKSWKVWPKFDASYLSSLALAVIAYVIAMLVLPGAWEWTLELDMVSASALSYTAQSLSREGIKAAARRK